MNRTVFTLCVSALLTVFYLPQAWADGRRLVVTTDAPIEIPGKVLSPGVYDFQYYVDSDGPAIVRVSAHNGRNYGWYFVMPVERRHATDQAEVDLDEPMAHSPERIRKWFFPDEKDGHEFVYRKRVKHTHLQAASGGGSPIVSVMADDGNPQP